MFVATGRSMDKPVERVRVLGTSPETDQAEYFGWVDYPDNYYQDASAARLL